MISLFKNIIKKFTKSPFKEYWETSKYGQIPKFPVIYFDRSIPHDFFFYDKVNYFYNEFIGDKPSKDEIIIDKYGKIFELTYHEQKFRYPKYTNQVMSPKEIKQILIDSEIEGLENYLTTSDTEQLIDELNKNKLIHKK
jgi:hypothetical protein